MTHATSSLSSHSSPSNDPISTKYATLGPATARPFTRPSLSPSFSSQEFRGQSLISIVHGREVGLSLPIGRKRPTRHEEIEDDEDADSSHHDLQSLSTDFCDRCCKYFANPLTKVTHWLYFTSYILSL